MDSCTHPITDSCLFFSFFFFFLLFFLLFFCVRTTSIYNHASGFSSYNASMIMGSLFVWSEVFLAADVQAKAVCIENGYIQKLSTIIIAAFLFFFFFLSI